MYNVRFGSKFIILQVDIQLCHNYLLKDFLPSCYCLKSNNHKWEDSFFIYSQLYFLDLYVCPLLVPQCLDYYNCVASSETPVFKPSHSILYYQGLLPIHSTLHFHTNFKKLVNIQKKKRKKTC